MSESHFRARLLLWQPAGVFALVAPDDMKVASIDDQKSCVNVFTLLLNLVHV